MMKLTAPEWHMRRVARQTLRATCVMARVMGGQDHIDAARTLGAPLPAGCTCNSFRTRREVK
jgi:hypothetical protein